jgi:hypothetical protein
VSIDNERPVLTITPDTTAHLEDAILNLLSDLGVAFDALRHLRFEDNESEGQLS